MSRPIARAAATDALRLYDASRAQLLAYYAARAELRAEQQASIDHATSTGFILPDAALVKRVAELDRATWRMRSQPISYIVTLFAIAPVTLRNWCRASKPEVGPVRWFWHGRERMACVEDVATKTAILLIDRDPGKHWGEAVSEDDAKLVGENDLQRLITK